MFYVYVLQSKNFPDRFYTGVTIDLKKRLAEHNSGASIHTNKFKPWILRTYLGFNNQKRAEDFERYLKTSSGRAFMTRVRTH
ncbi:MAG: GIY-YIG nuclease family protein [Proteobacteria bacterium]|nr:GIY-YIG nuclease family protein [Pseudomonadota bacterium]